MACASSRLSAPTAAAHRPARAGSPRAARGAGARAAARPVRARPRRARTRQRRGGRPGGARAAVRRRRRPTATSETYAATVRGYLRADTRWEVGQAAATARGRTREAAHARAPAAQRPVRRAELLPRVVPVARAAQARLAGGRAQLGRRPRTRRASTTAQDYAFAWDPSRRRRRLARHLRVLPASRSRSYDIFHFSNANGMRFGHPLHDMVAKQVHPYAEIELLRRLGKKIVYSNNGCLDGVAQTSFASWGDRPVCLRLPVARPAGRLQRRAEPARGATTATGWPTSSATPATTARTTTTTRAVHEVPEFFCLDPDFWRPDLEVPERWRLDLPESTVRIYHAVGNFQQRTAGGRNIKSTHIYVPLVERMKARGLRRRADVRARRAEPRGPLHAGAGRHRRRHAHVRLVRVQRPRGADARQASGLLPAA